MIFPTLNLQFKALRKNSFECNKNKNKKKDKYFYFLSTFIAS